MGLDIHSADRIVPEWQGIDVGDEVKFHPEGGMTAAVVKPGRALVLRGGMPGTPPFDFGRPSSCAASRTAPLGSWCASATANLRWWAPLLVEPVEFISFVMSQRMLRGIKEGAERAVSRRDPDLRIT